jgi:hypothetical protein
VSRKLKSYNTKASAPIATVILKDQWDPFLEAFGRLHHGWPTRIETKDTVTREEVVSHESPLESIELDLEDERNPRINVTVKLDNKLVKHILFLPSRVVHRTYGNEESIEIETLNTETTIYVRPREQ